MKNKILITIFGVLLLILISTLPTYAAEANVIFEKESGSANKVKVILEVSEDQSVTKTNVALDVNASNKENLKNAEFNFSNEISSNSEMAKWTYHNDKINLYVISKNELASKSSNGKKAIELGTLTVNTNNNEEIAVDIVAANGGVTIASVDHRTANITNDTSASTQLKIGTATSGGNQQGGNNNQPGNDNQGNNQGNNPAGGSNSGNNGSNQSGGSSNNNQSGGNGNSSNSGNRRPNNTNNNNINTGNDNQEEDGNNIINETNTNEISNNINSVNSNNIVNNNKTNTVQSSKKLPEAGKEEKSMVMPIIITLILLVFAATIILRIKVNNAKKHKKGNYKL